MAKITVYPYEIPEEELDMLCRMVPYTITANGAVKISTEVLREWLEPRHSITDFYKRLYEQVLGEPCTSMYFVEESVSVDAY